MEINETINIDRASARSLIVFQAHVEFNATALNDLIKKAVEENDSKINPHSRVALGITLANIGQRAEDSYELFCIEYGADEMVMVNPKIPHFNQLNSPMVKDTVEDTLSEIVNVVQVAATAFCDKLESTKEIDDLNVAELRGLYTMLSTIRGAAFICAKSILGVESQSKTARQSSQESLDKQIKAFLH